MPEFVSALSAESSCPASSGMQTCLTVIHLPSAQRLVGRPIRRHRTAREIREYNLAGQFFASAGAVKGCLNAGGCIPGGHVFPDA